MRTPEPSRTGQTEPAPPKPLSAKRARFVDEYLISLNASDAARKAGYSRKAAHDTGFEILRDPDVQAEIARRQEALRIAKQIELTDLVNQTAQLAFANIGAYFKLTSDGEPYIDLSTCTRGELAALQEIGIVDVVEGRGDDARLVRKVRIKLADKLRALDLLRQLLGLGAPKQVSVNGKLQVEATAAADGAAAEAFMRMDADQLREYVHLHEAQQALLAGARGEKGDEAA